MAADLGISLSSAGVLAGLGQGRFSGTMDDPGLLLGNMRFLTRQELELCGPGALPAGLTDNAPVQKLRHRQHLLAKGLANGKRPIDLAEELGYSVVRISILQNDPAFRELIAFYAKERNEIFADAQRRLANLALDVVEELHERLEDQPEKFSNAALISLAELALDRTGLPAARSGSGNNFSVNVNAGSGPGGTSGLQVVFVQHDPPATPEQFIEGTVVESEAWNGDKK